MEVIDISIHLLDQLRFECMRRLNWLERGGEQQLPIVELIEQYQPTRKQGQEAIPPLHTSHPKYQRYEKLSDLEKETFIRKQIPRAIEEFSKRLQD